MTAATLAIASAAVYPGMTSSSASQGARVRLLPVPGVTYPESFLNFIRKARFRSIRDAVAAIRDPRLPVRVTHVPLMADGSLPPPAPGVPSLTGRDIPPSPES